MTSTFFQRLLIIILLAGTIPTLWAQEYKYEIGGMAGGAFYMGDANKNTIFKGMNPAVGAVFTRRGGGEVHYDQCQQDK